MIPSLLASRLQSILGDDYTSVIDSFAKNRKGSFRLNYLYGDGEEVFEEFLKKGIIIDSFLGLEGVFVFDRDYEYAIKGTRAFYDGKIYLQSIASMLPVLALAPIGGETILDVCAAPGSKTTQLVMLMKNCGSIFAIEQNQIRFDKLMHNCKLQGATIIEGIKMDARHWLDGTSGNIVVGDDFSGIEFDRILLDAPCSAEGRISLDNEKTYGFWSLDNIRKKSELQGELLELAFSRLKKGGVLVYSTCTLAPEENEGVISDFLLAHSDATIESIDIGMSEKKWWKSGLLSFDSKVHYPDSLSQAVRILPSDETEGFFMVKLRKN